VANASNLVHHGDEERPTRWDRAIAELADRQHGRVSREQLFDLGLGRGAIDLRLRRGRLHRVHQGVYAVGHQCAGKEGQWMAAALAGGAGAVLSHASAAALWSLRETAPGDVDVTVERRRKRRPGLRFHLRALPPDEVTTRDDIPVTTVPRTIFDLAADHNRREVERAIHEAEVQRLYDRLSLHDLVARYPNRQGIGTIKSILAEMDRAIAYTQNDFEELFHDCLVRYGLPMPVFNAWLHVAGRWIRPDCAWHEQRIIVELDGAAVHGTRRNRESDPARDRMLTVAGWRVVRVTWNQLRYDPEPIAADLRVLLS
jgi:predicted transcriptional regulator of viral defense system